MSSWDRPAPDAEDVGAEACEDYLESCGCVVFSDDKVGELVDRLVAYVQNNSKYPFNEQSLGRQSELEDLLEGYFGFSKQMIEEIKKEALK
jgi:hypothetical protein